MTEQIAMVRHLKHMTEHGIVDDITLVTERQVFKHPLYTLEWEPSDFERDKFCIRGFHTDALTLRTMAGHHVMDVEATSPHPNKNHVIELTLKGLNDVDAVELCSTVPDLDFYYNLRPVLLRIGERYFLCEEGIILGAHDFKGLLDIREFSNIPPVEDSETRPKFVIQNVIRSLTKYRNFQHHFIGRYGYDSPHSGKQYWKKIEEMYPEETDDGFKAATMATLTGLRPTLYFNGVELPADPAQFHFDSILNSLLKEIPQS